MTRFKEAREKAGYTQKEAAFHLDVSIQAVSYWETGNRTPSIEKIVQMCDLYSVTADYLLGRSPMKASLMEGSPPEQMEGYHHIVFEPDERPDFNDLETVVRKVVEQEFKKRGL